MRGGRLGDFSRFIFDPRKRYDIVYMQQGRVQLDADWNAQAEATDYRIRCSIQDLIGPYGAPVERAGYEILADSALRLDGLDQCLVIEGALLGEVDLGSGVSIEVLFTPPEGASGTILSWLVEPGGEEGHYQEVFSLVLREDGRIRLAGGAGSWPDLLSEARLAPDEAAHVTLTCDAERVGLYAQGSPVFGSPGGAAPPGTGMLVIGAGLVDGRFGRFLRGGVHEVRLWRTALAPERVVAGQGLAVEAEDVDLAGLWLLHEARGPLIAEHRGGSTPARLRGRPTGAAPNGVLSDLRIGAGRYYVEGVLCEAFRTVPYTQQPDYPDARPPNPLLGDVHVFYLDVWQRHVTPVQDPGLSEVALGGADTTTRGRVVAQVKSVPLGAVDAFGGPALARRTWERFVHQARRRGRLRARRDPRSPQVLGNLLYRVEIHTPGGLLGGRRARGGDTARAVRQWYPVPGEAAAPGIVLQIDPPDWGRLVHQWRAGDCVEVCAEEAIAVRREGSLAFVATINHADRSITLDGALPDEGAQAPLSLRRIATFKWSRMNGSQVLPIAPLTPGARAVEFVLPPTGELAFAAGDWVELLDDRYVLLEQAYPLLQVEQVDRAQGRMRLSAAPRSGVGGDAAEHPFLRRWDQGADHGPLLGGVVPALAGRWIALEAGIEVRFEDDGPYRGRDYWWLPAREATQDIEWPQRHDEPRALKPAGVDHDYAPLASLRFAGGGFELRDERTLFQPAGGGWVSKAGDSIQGDLEVRGELAVRRSIEAPLLVAGELFGALASPGSVRHMNIVTGAVSADKLAPEVGALAPGAGILTDSPEPTDGYRWTGARLVLDAAEQSWLQRNEVPLDALSAAHAVALGGTVFVLLESGEVFEYEPAQASVRARRPLPETRRGCAVAGVHRRIFVLGGADASGTLSDSVFEYDLEADHWSERRPMPRPRRALAAAAVGGRIIALGGLRFRFGLEWTTARAELYDPATDSWRRLRSMPTARSALGAAAAGGEVYALGGERRWFLRLFGRRLSDANEVLRLSGNRWSRAPSPMPDRRARPAVGAGGSKLYVVGGRTAFGWTQDVEVYDRGADSWSAAPPLRAPVAWPAVAVVAGVLTAAGTKTGLESPLLWLDEYPALREVYLHQWVGHPELRERLEP